MTRYLCWLAVLGVVLVPDWASASRPFLARPVFARPFFARPILARPIFPILERPILARPVFGRPYYESSGPPMYYPPAYSPCQPDYGYPPAYVVPSPNPVPSPMLPPPRIETIPKSAIPAPAPAPGGMGTGNSRPPTNDAVRPVAGSDANPSKKVDPAVSSGDMGLPAFPEVEIPKNLGPLPKLDVPKDPDLHAIPVPKKPATAVPEAAPPLPDLNPKLPPIEVPKTPSVATPAPAPAPMPAPTFPEPLIPSPSVPELPGVKKESLPSLTLPPDVPVKTDSTSRSSPLSGGGRGMTVSVFAATGTERPTDGYRTVGFFNHTDRDLNLTIEGRAVKLPARSYLHAKLAPTFTWGHGDRPAARETVPDGAGGVDVVFRD
jgi:hypothetical protein